MGLPPGGVILTVKSPNQVWLRLRFIVIWLARVTEPGTPVTTIVFVKGAPGDW